MLTVIVCGLTGVAPVAGLAPRTAAGMTAASRIASASASASAAPTSRRAARRTADFLYM